MDDYVIVHAPSLDALVAAHSRAEETAPASLAVVINPTGDLPGSRTGRQTCCLLLPQGARTVLERDRATASAVLKALKGKTHWHFASHGTFSWQDARQSALIMHGKERLSVGRLLDAEGLGRPREPSFSLPAKPGFTTFRAIRMNSSACLEHSPPLGRQAWWEPCGRCGRGNGVTGCQILRAALGRQTGAAYGLASRSSLAAGT